MAKPIKVHQWTWQKDFTIAMALYVALWLSAAGKYLGEIQGAGNVFAALCWFFFVVGVILFLSRPTLVTRGKPVPVSLMGWGLYWGAALAAVWHGSWWHFGGMVTYCLASCVHRMVAEEQFAAQEVPHA